MKIKNLNLKGPLVLAPMAGVTNLPFRILCKKYGASLSFTEMISVNAVHQKNLKTTDLARTCKEERPIGIQFFGNNPKYIQESVKIFEKNFDLVDFNFGCPVQKVVKNGYGSALLKKPEKMREIIKALCESTHKPVTAKMRISTRLENTLKIAKIIEKAGADAITVHARTASQGYSGKANLEAIKKVKESISIPVIGNGGIEKEEHVVEMFEKTGCDSVMIGRKAMGNPYFFRQCDYFLKMGKKLRPQTKEERIADFFEYIKLGRKYKVNIEGTIKQQAHHFTSGLNDSKKLRCEINKANSFDEVMELLNKN